MVKEAINFRYEIGAGKRVRLIHRNRKSGRLTGGFMHFPPGCNAVVQVRILVAGPASGQERQIIPIQDEYVALDDANWEFELDEDIIKDDNILVEMRNTGGSKHQITVIVTRYSDEPTQTKLEKEDKKERAQKRRDNR